MVDWIINVLVIGIPIIMAMVLHELAHGYAALALGDDTAKRLGRLSLNPIRHVDPVGTLLLPGTLILLQTLFVGHIVFLFGWAKPVPIAAYRFPNPRRGMAIVAAAGPLANFVLAWLAALAFHLVPDLSPGDISPSVTWPSDMLSMFIQFNLVLGLFNLLPIPPMDGGRIVVGLLPERQAATWASLERVGLALVLGIVVLLPQLLSEFGIRFDPVGAMLGTVLPRAMNLVFRLAFLHA